jgi:RNA polymerase sigma factor (sigma-70 family)
MSNIKDEKAYDPFPKTGLVRKYAPFIRKEVRDYCKIYPYMRYEDMLAEAIRLAVKCEARFKPELGNDFTTPLRWDLRGLHRFAQRDHRSWQMPVSKDQRDANDLEKKRNGIGGEDPQPANFSGGGNGARITIDFQWMDGPETRHRIVLGTQMRGRDWDYANGVVDRATPDIKTVLEGRKPSPITAGYVRGVMHHNERRQRESDQEAENRLNGDYAPVFLKPDRQQIDIGFYEGRKPPKLEADYVPVASLDEAHTDDEGSKSTLADIVADESPVINAEAREDEARIEADNIRFLAIVDAERPLLSPNETVVLDNSLLGPLTIAEVADKVGMTPGGVSKMAARLEKKLRAKNNLK